jgi:hypothetical protein
MPLIRTTYLTSAIVAASLALPLAAMAQTVNPTTGEMGKSGAATAPASAAAKSDESVQQRLEQRIADMHETLHVTGAQDAQFEKFAQVMRDNAEQMQATLAARNARIATETAVESLQAYAQLAEQHAKDVERLSAAFQTFYDALTPAQKKDADEMFRATAMRHCRARAPIARAHCRECGRVQ